MQAEELCPVIVEKAYFTKGILCNDADVAVCVEVDYRNTSPKVAKAVKFQGDLHPLEVFALQGTRFNPEYVPTSLMSKYPVKAGKTGFAAEHIRYPNAQPRTVVKAWPIKVVFGDGSVWEPFGDPKACFAPASKKK